MREYRASSPEKDGEDVEEERIARRWVGCADSVSMKTFLALSKALLCRCFRASSAGLRPWLFFCKVPENRESRDWAGWEIGQKRTRKSGFRSQRREQYVVRKCSTRLSTSCCSFPALSRFKSPGLRHCAVVDAAANRRTRGLKLTNAQKRRNQSCRFTFFPRPSNAAW